MMMDACNAAEKKNLKKVQNEDVLELENEAYLTCGAATRSAA